MAVFVEEIRTEECSQFDYSALGKEARVLVQQQTAEIRSLMRRTAQDILEIGQRLKEVKAQLGHGQFRNWLQSEFEMSVSAANKFMQVHEYFKNVNFTDLQVALSALYLLAAPSTPSDARQEALFRASQGENITYSKAKAIVRDRKATQAVQKQTIDVSAQTTEIRDSKEVPNNANKDTKTVAQGTLFRLWVDDIGTIIRLYQKDELEGRGELRVGATVVIKEGHLQGQTALIQEAFRNEPIEVSDEEEINQIEREEPKRAENERQIEINYAGIRVALEGCPEDLMSFCKQIQSNPNFLNEIVRQLTSSKQTKTN